MRSSSNDTHSMKLFQHKGTDDNGGDIQSDWIPSLMLSIFACVSSITTFYIAVFFKEQLGFSGAQIGVLFSIQAITGILASFPAGILNDRASSRSLVAVSLIVQAIALVMMGVVRNFSLYMGVFFFYSLFIWVFRQSIDIQFLKTQSRHHVGIRIGFYQTWRFIGASIGAVCSGWFIAAYDFTITLMTAGVIMLILAIPSALLKPTPVSKPLLSDYKADFSNRKVLFFSAWMLIFATHWGAEQTCYGLFLRHHFELTMNQMGYYIASEFLAIIITMIYIGNKIQGSAYAKKVICYGLAASGFGHIGMILDPIFVSVIFRVIHGVGDGCMLMIFYYGIYKLFSLEHLGGNSGLINLTTMVGYIAGSLIYGPIGDAFSYSAPLWMSGVTTLVLIYPLVSKRFQHLAFSSG